jgi:hypothetical protein
LTTHDRLSCENSRSRPIEGSATLTIDASSTMTNCVMASRASARPLFGAEEGDMWVKLL